MICDSLVVLTLDLVCHLACVDEFLHTTLDGLSALGDFLNELEVALREFVGLVGRIDTAHVLHVLHEH